MKARASWLCASALALVWCGTAAAQTTAPSPPAASPADGVQGGAANAATPTIDGVDPQQGAFATEVVVTAERRSTNLQTTAISAQVLSGSDLENRGVTTVDQLQFATPSVTLQSFGQGNDFNIRGIGKSVTNSTVGVGVITYRDGVATFPGYFQEEPYYDIANLEVLRGPQGTFIGQNAIGGAVFITEANPDFSGLHGYIQGQVGNYDDAGLQGAINIPVNDKLAVRLAFNDEYRGSFYDVTGAAGASVGLLKETSARFSLLWTPTSQLSISFKLDAHDLNLGGYPDSPATAKTDPFKISSDTDNFAEDRFGRAVLDATYTFADGIKLRSVTGFQEGRTAAKYDLDGTDLANFAINDHADEQAFSQEFNLISPTGGFFTWVAGLYYQHDNIKYPVGDTPGYQLIYPGIINYFFNGKQSNGTVAEFGQVTFNLPAGFQIEAGLRNSTSFNANHLNINYDYPTGDIFLPQDQTERDSKVTGKVALNWTVDRNNFLYAFVATGHKSGGLNAPSAPGPGAVVRPEDVTDYETGWKNEALGRHLRSQVDFYYYDYHDFQVTVGNPILPTASEVFNVPSKTTLYGIELQEQAVFGPLAFNFGGSYAHSSLGRFFAADSRLPVTAPTCDPRSGPAGGGCDELTGNRQVFAPIYTLDGGVQYAVKLGPGTLTPRLDYSHIGTQWATVFENSSLGDKLGVRNLLNAQLTYVTGSYTLTAYGTNLNDQHYISGVSAGLRFAGAPRQYGVRLQKVF